MASRLALPPPLRRDHLATALAVAYLLAVVSLDLLRHAAGYPTPTQFAANPTAVASGKFWLLVTSALIVNGPAILELSGFIAAMVLLIRRHGGLLFWRVVVVSHVGSTLLAYAGVGLLWLTAPTAVKEVVERPDYGVSAAWMGVLGALFASSCRSLARGANRSSARFLFIVCSGAAIVSFSFFPFLAGIEHLLAFALGAAVLLAFATDRKALRPFEADYELGFERAGAGS